MNPKDLPEITNLSPAKRALRSAVKLFAPPPKLTIAEWAEANRWLPVGQSAIPGRFSLSVTPYLREILETINDPQIERVVCRKSSQIGWTDGVVNNVVGYYMDVDPSPMLIMFPIEDMAKSYSAQDFVNLVEGTQRLKNIVVSDTIDRKHYHGMELKLVWSNSLPKLSSMRKRIAIIEEPDRCMAASREGDSIKLIEQRTKTFERRKIILGGTPTIKYFSQIDREIELSDQRRWFVPCHHCGEFQELKWTQVRWSKDGDPPHPVYGEHRPETARYVCEHCGGEWSNEEKNANVRRGHWRATAPFRGTAGFILNELLSPFPRARLQDIVADYLQAQAEARKGNFELLKTWTQNRLGEAWEEPVEEIASDILEARAEDYPRGFVPAGATILTAGVDVQADRFEVVVWAWGRGMECWAIDHAVISGDTGQEEPWQRLDDYLSSGFRHAWGGSLRIRATAIDSGHLTDAVYDFCRARANRAVLPVKGIQGYGQPIKAGSTLQDVSWRGKRMSRGVRLWTVATHTAKDWWSAHLKVRAVGPGFVHVTRNMPPSFFAQMTSEVRASVQVNGQQRHRWELKPGARNEAWDCSVYALFAAMWLGLDSLSASQWQAMEEELRPKPGDLFSGADLPAAGGEPPAEKSEEGAASERETAAPDSHFLRPGSGARRSRFVHEWRRW